MQRRLCHQAIANPSRSCVPQPRGAPASRAAGPAEFPRERSAGFTESIADRAAGEAAGAGPVPASRSVGHGPSPGHGSAGPGRCGRRRGRRAGGTEAPGEASGARRPPSHLPPLPSGRGQPRRLTRRKLRCPRSELRLACGGRLWLPAPLVSEPLVPEPLVPKPLTTGAPRTGAPRYRSPSLPEPLAAGAEPSAVPSAAAAAPRGSRCAAPHAARSGTA